MQPIDANAILLAVLGLVFIYLVAAMLTVDGWVLYRLVTGRPVLPPSPLVPRQSVPWGAWTVLLLFVLNLVLPQCVFIAYAIQNGLLRNRSRPTVHRVTAHAEKPPQQGRPPAPETKSPESKIAPAHSPPAEKPNPAQTQPKEQPAEPSDELSPSNGLHLSLTELLALQAVSSVGLLFFASLVLRITSRSPFRDLGLSLNRWWLQAGVGLIAFLAIQPALMATQAAMTRIWESRQHPLLKMVTDEFSPGVPQLAILLAVVVAPIAEELIFRGVIQSWLVDRAASALNGMSSSKSAGVTPNSPVSPSQPRSSGPEPHSPENLAPSAATHAPPPETIDASSEPPKLPPDMAASVHLSPQPNEPSPSNSRLQRRAAAFVGVSLTSLVFAALHFDQWPAPIALFLLAAAIGFVYERTGSLIAAICMHAAFNGLSTFLLLSSLLVPQSAQHPELPKIKKTAAVSENSNARDCACIHCGKRETTRRFL